MPAATTCGRYVAPIFAVELVGMRPGREPTHAMDQPNAFGWLETKALEVGRARRDR